MVGRACDELFAELLGRDIAVDDGVCDGLLRRKFSSNDLLALPHGEPTIHHFNWNWMLGGVLGRFEECMHEDATRGIEATISDIEERFNNV